MTQTNFHHQVLIAIFSLVLLFHTLVLLGVVPYGAVWGGRLTSFGEMIVFETISMVLNGYFLYVILVKTGYVKNRLPRRVITGTLWGMVILFALNTVGNLFAVNPLERYLATPITFLLSILCFVLVREK